MKDEPALLREAFGVRRFPALSVASVLFLTGTTWAQVQVLPQHQVPQVFDGESRTLTLFLHNSGEQPTQVDLRARLYQVSSATAVNLGDRPWKTLQVLPGQTILEAATLDFPPVKAETGFSIHWLDNTNKVLGKTEVRVYPSDLLKELETLAGNEPLGVFDPQNVLKPLLKAVKTDFLDLEDIGLDHFQGKLAILGPVQSKQQTRDGFGAAIKALARKGVVVVWIQPPPRRAELIPSFYTLPIGSGTVVFVQAEMVPDLPHSPQAQLNLVRLARLAVHPQPLQLPDLLSER